MKSLVSVTIEWYAHPSDKFDALCEVLNWTEKEAAQAEQIIAGTFDNLRRDERTEDLAPYQERLLRDEASFRGITNLIRELARAIVDTEHAGPYQAAELGLHDLTEGDAQTALKTLEVVASHSPMVMELGDEDSVVKPTSWWLEETSRVIWAVQALWPILEGKTRLLRCPAPAPGHSDPKRKCGHYFVSGGKIGRPALFCSEACCKRDSRVRKKVRDREGSEESKRTRVLNGGPKL